MKGGVVCLYYIFDFNDHLKMAAIDAVARSSTPSRKRSKWDEDEGEGEQPCVPQPKKRAKPKSIRRALSASESADSPSPSSSNSRPVSTETRVNTKNSIYVPPRTHHPPLQPSRSVYSYERLNQIEEGSYGVVFRARDKQTGDIVALKKLKLEEEKNGFPITALREIHALMSCRHENVVGVREVVVGDTLTQCVSCFSTGIEMLCNHKLLLIHAFCAFQHLLTTALDTCRKSVRRYGLYRT